MPRLPGSPNGSPLGTRSNQWRGPRRSSSNARAPTFGSRSPAEIRDNAINTAERFYRRFLKIWNKLSNLQKGLVVLALIVINVGAILFLIYNEKIFGWLEPYAEKWKKTTGGWTILWTITFLTAFPPMIGYSSCGTTAGFIYGVWEGWLILATASVAGSFCSFIVSRTILKKYVERMVANDKRFAAMTLTLKEDGLKLLCLIRLCPLPYSLSNGAMSTFPTVSPQMYALATAIVSPKLLIHAFIGSRLAAIGKSHEEMSTGTKALNYGSVVLGGLLGTAVGLYIYNKTMSRARELEAEQVANVRNAERRTGTMPKPFADDPEAQVAAETIADDSPDYFDEATDQRYRDDSEDDSFSRGDGSDNEGIGMQGQR